MAAFLCTFTMIRMNFRIWLKVKPLIQIGDRNFDAKPGRGPLGSTRVPHSHRRLIPSLGIGGYIRAGDMEEFFRKVAERRQKDPKAALDDLFSAHGMTIVGPSV